ncbi:uroporphyrinogen-III synthase [Acanthopleuribacter pedis]|uniref:Uroporphyrinogen-III synthase n=1 Tax=Acanthopleuribacter pedis TaxID=442870 RepID=A0A8J7QCJ9_9BACT|nr:uroporphyrinogen-III synthase [Acanthopleuribacter pedis]MBO1317060.1 uroporphyrinogen-III synthase [Acanthopleuribacter pedis]
MQFLFTQLDPVPIEVRQALQAKGWTVGHLPFRKVVFQPPSEPPDWPHHEAVVITSKQAAKWFADHAPPNAPPVAAVGAATHALLEAADCWFRDAPPANADELVTRLRQRIGTRPTRLLFLCGNKTKATVPDAFPDGECTLYKVYATRKLSKVFPPVAPNSMVYFQAPTTALDYFSSFQTSPPRVAVIGPSTAATVRRLGWTIDFQPSRPETAALIRELPAPDQLALKARE